MAIVNGRFTFIAHRPATPYTNPVPAPRQSFGPEHIRRPPSPSFLPPVHGPRRARRGDLSIPEAKRKLRCTSRPIAIRAPGDLCARVCRAAAINIRIYIYMYTSADGKSLSMSACTGISRDVNEPGLDPAEGTMTGLFTFLNNGANPPDRSENDMSRRSHDNTTIYTLPHFVSRFETPTMNVCCKSGGTISGFGYFGKTFSAFPIKTH